VLASFEGSPLAKRRSRERRGGRRANGVVRWASRIPAQLKVAAIGGCSLQ
jgi:hypothetical protein